MHDIGKVGIRRRHPAQAGHVQRSLAAELVAQAAGGQQQAGEHQRVAIDDPLQLAVGGAQFVDQRGDGHVEDGVVHHDDQQAETQRGQGEPSPSVGTLVDHVDRVIVITSLVTTSLVTGRPFEHEQLFCIVNPGLRDCTAGRGVNGHTGLVSAELCTGPVRTLLREQYDESVIKTKRNIAKKK